MQPAKTEAQEKARSLWNARKIAKEELRKANRHARAKRTPQQQLDILDERLGKGKGAQKERAKLEAEILIDEQIGTQDKKNKRQKKTTKKESK